VSEPAFGDVFKDPDDGEIVMMLCRGLSDFGPDYPHVTIVLKEADSIVADVVSTDVTKELDWERLG
jgi:hypothetical protein